MATVTIEADELVLRVPLNERGRKNFAALQQLAAELRDPSSLFEWLDHGFWRRGATNELDDYAELLEELPSYMLGWAALAVCDELPTEDEPLPKSLEVWNERLDNYAAQCLDPNPGQPPPERWRQIIDEALELDETAAICSLGQLENWFVPDTQEQIAVWREAIGRAMKWDISGALQALERYRNLRVQSYTAFEEQYELLENEAHSKWCELRARQEKARRSVEQQRLRDGAPTRNNELRWKVSDRSDHSDNDAMVTITCPECSSSVRIRAVARFPVNCVSCKTFLVRQAGAAKTL